MPWGAFVMNSWWIQVKIQYVVRGHANCSCVAMMKNYDQKQEGEERVYLTHISTSQSITEGREDRNSNRTGA